MHTQSHPGVSGPSQCQSQPKQSQRTIPSWVYAVVGFVVVAGIVLVVALLVLGSKTTDSQKQKPKPACFIEDNKLMYTKRLIKKTDGYYYDSKSIEEECHSALMAEVNATCGADSFLAKNLSTPKCLVHGSKERYQWTMPKLTDKHELWTIALLEDQKDNVNFRWTVWYALPKGWIGIFSVTQPEKCKYVAQNYANDIGLNDHLKNRDEAVYRMNYGQPIAGDQLYTNLSKIDSKRKHPDAWIYSSKAANHCGLKLLKTIKVQEKY